MYMDASLNGNRIERTALARYGEFEAIEAAIVKAIVRGEQSVGTLKDTTVRISARGITRSFGSPAPLFAPIRSSDLAEGLLNLNGDSAALAEWARFILVTSELFGLDDRHTDYCDRLFAVIWDLAFGTPVGAPTIHLARTIRSRFAKE